MLFILIVIYLGTNKVVLLLSANPAVIEKKTFTKIFSLISGSVNTCSVELQGTFYACLSSGR